MKNTTNHVFFEAFVNVEETERSSITGAMLIERQLGQSDFKVLQDDIKTEHMGRGSFKFVPKPDHYY